VLNRNINSYRAVTFLIVAAIAALSLAGSANAQSRPAQSQAAAAEKPKVAVYVTGGKNANENKVLSARITHALVGSGKYNTIERSDAFLDQVAKEMTAQRSGAIDDRQISELGLQAGANFVCIGEMIEAFGAHQISARIINVVSVEVVASGLASGNLRSMADFATLSDHVVGSLLGTAQTTGPNTRVSASDLAAPSTAAPVQNIIGKAADFSKDQPSIVVDGKSLMEKLQWLRNNAASNTGYLVELKSNELIAPQTISFPDKNDVRVWLRGADGERTISLDGTGTLLAIGEGLTLILDANATLRGISNNNAPLVRVMSEGKLIMNAGAKISGNTSTGGLAHNNHGIGVFVEADGMFTMNGGEISGNTDKNEWTNGGGVYVDETGIFTMKNGVISGNNAKNGGGVFVKRNGKFIMENGEISGNRGARGGGGIHVDKGGNFTMRNGKISGNTMSMNEQGAGVYLDEAGNFTMEGGVISGNRAIVSDRVQYGHGGGVFVNNGHFIKTGGIIYGYADGDSNSNHVSHRFGQRQQEQLGNAVCVSSGNNGACVSARETTAGSKVNLDSRKSGRDGGWETAGNTSGAIQAAPAAAPAGRGR